MLKLHPACEHCNKQLPPNSTDAMICSYECTFCQSCVESVLYNVCPNCGGGFSLRPIRPAHNLINNSYLGQDRHQSLLFINLLMLLSITNSH